jgi:hypothetical protein
MKFQLRQEKSPSLEKTLSSPEKKEDEILTSPGKVTFIGENFVFAREERKIKARLSEDKNLASLDN